MPNGRTWTKTEIDQLVRASLEGGGAALLAERMERTPEAVISKARKLNVRLPLAP